MFKSPPSAPTDPTLRNTSTPLQTKARKLHERADGSLSRSLDVLDRHQIDDIDRVLDAVDVWAKWFNGHRVATARLADAVETLNDVAQHAPGFALKQGEVDRTQWYELLDPVNQLLADHVTAEALIGFCHTRFGHGILRVE